MPQAQQQKLSSSFTAVIQCLAQLLQLGQGNFTGHSEDIAENPAPTGKGKRHTNSANMQGSCYQCVLRIYLPSRGGHLRRCCAETAKPKLQERLVFGWRVIFGKV